MKILITGAHGQIGSALRRSLAVLGELAAFGHAACDLTQPHAVRRLVRELRPDVIVNAAGYTDVEGAEREPGRAMAVNGDGTALLAEEAAGLDALLVHYSSDYVFDGELGRPYAETDAPSPRNAYGRSKLAGDLAAAGAPRHLVLRTSWVYGVQGANFMKTMLGLLMRRSRVDVVADQHGAPTGAALVADVTAHLLARHARRSEDDGADFPYGLYHLSASGETSWHGYACLIAALARAGGLALQAAPDGIRPIPAAAYPSAAARPANSRLDTAKLREAFGLRLPPWQAGVELAMQELIEGGRACAS